MFLHDAASCTTSAPPERNARLAMRTVLTQALIEKLPVPVKVEDHRDVRLKGLVLRVSPSGVKSFYCEYARGKRIWLGRADAPGLAEARESARVVLSEGYRGIDPRSEARTSELQSPLSNTYAVFCS